MAGTFQTCQVSSGHIRISKSYNVFEGCILCLIVTLDVWGRVHKHIVMRAVSATAIESGARFSSGCQFSGRCVLWRPS